MIPSAVDQKLTCENASGRFLFLLTDAYGELGGISQFNRDFLEAMSISPYCAETVVFPRLVRYNIHEEIPDKIHFIDKGITTIPHYIKNLMAFLFKDSRFNIIICGHINLLSIAWPLSWILQMKLVLIIHGIDAWTPTKRPIVNFFASKVDYVVSASQTTLDRFCSWTTFSHRKGIVLPNCVDLEHFTPGPKNPKLVDRYGLQDKCVLMTLGRMPGPDRQKGYDEVIEILPHLKMKIPNLVYLLGGDGPDKDRLSKKAHELGVAEQVVFTGMIGENEKVDHYRLADVYVMPSQGEGFGIVLLEAMSCGIPVVASKLDGGREALRDGMLGVLVDPSSVEDIIIGIEKALRFERQVPPGLTYFSKSNFQRRVCKMINTVMVKECK